MSAAEAKTEFSMWAILASPMIVTTPLLRCTSSGCVPSLTALQREILLNTEILSINQDVTPAGRLVALPWLPSFMGGGVYARNLSGGDVALAFYNPADLPAQDFFVDFVRLGWTAETSASARDLWAHAEVGNATGRFPAAPHTLTVAPHETRVFRLTPVRLGGAPPDAGVCHVRQLGAVGDNRTDDTAAFAKAILRPTCTTIVVEPGAYLLRPLPGLHSNTELVLQPGAVLQLWRELRTYPNATAEYYAQWGQNVSDCFVIAVNQSAVCRSAPLLRADHVENVTIRGVRRPQVLSLSCAVLSDE